MLQFKQLFREIYMRRETGKWNDLCGVQRDNTKQKTSERCSIETDSLRPYLTVQQKMAISPIIQIAEMIVSFKRLFTFHLHLSI
jgi:hypothetical protein